MDCDSCVLTSTLVMELNLEIIDLLSTVVGNHCRWLYGTPGRMPREVRMVNERLNWDPLPGKV